MIFTAGLLIGLGILCFLLTIVSVIFTIITFANSKPSKFIWLTTLLVSLFGLIMCIYLVIHKAVNKAQSFATTQFEAFENITDSLLHYQDSLSLMMNEHPVNAKHINLLKSYLPADLLEKVPDQFYNYLGYGNYYRFPLRYPFSIHCSDAKTNGELFNEVNVNRFDENDNGEVTTGIASISKIAFDKRYLLLEQHVTSNHSQKDVQHFILFSFDTEKKQEVKSEKELFKLAKQNGYAGSDSLITIEQYDALFYQ